MQQTEHRGRLLFLEEFTKELIRNSRPKINFSQPLTREIEEHEKIPIKITSVQTLFKQPRLIQPQPKIIPRQAIKIQEKPKIQPAQFNPGLIQASKQKLSLGKIDKLIKNSSISMIECPGPEKLLVVKTNEKTEVTKISLKEEEIKDIIKQFAEQAKTPLTTGIFKATVESLLITAILSDFAGSRFIITRRNAASSA